MTKDIVATPIAEYSSELAEEPPAFAWIGLTGRCNLRCAHCSIRFAENQNSRELSEKLFNTFERDILPYLRAVKVGGNNLGEPLMAKNWDRYVNALIAGRVKLTVQTNGLLLSRPRLEPLIKAGAELDISLEGADADSYQRVRGKSFDRLIDKIKLVNEVRSAYPESGSRVLFSFTLFQDNADQLDRLIELAANLSVDGIVVTHLVPVEERQRYQSLVYHRSLSNAVTAAAGEKAAALGIDFFAPAPFHIGSLTNGEQADKTNRAAFRPCFHPWLSTSINENGDVLPCCGAYTVMGNLGKAGFAEIWNNRAYRRLRRTVNSAKPPAACRDCVLRDLDANDEGTLLAGIGPHDRFNPQTIISRRLQRYLRQSTWGRTALPKLKRLYKTRS